MHGAHTRARCQRALHTLEQKRRRGSLIQARGLAAPVARSRNRRPQQQPALVAAATREHAKPPRPPLRLDLDATTEAARQHQRAPAAASTSTRVSATIPSRIAC